MPSQPATRATGERQRDPDRTKAEILAVAQREFARHGYAGARVDEIADLTRTTKRMIYYYFGGKEQLYIAALENAYSEVRAVERTQSLAVVQVRQDGEDAAVVVGRRPQLELGEDVGDVLLHRATAEDQLAGDGEVRATLGHQAEHLDLTGGQGGEATGVDGGGGGHRAVSSDPLLGGTERDGSNVRVGVDQSKGHRVHA